MRLRTKISLLGIRYLTRRTRKRSVQSVVNDNDVTREREDRLAKLFSCSE